MLSPIRLKKTVGEAYNVTAEDALTTKNALSQLGHMEIPDYGLDEFPDAPMVEAIRSFQRAQGLTEDGVMKPDGPTLERLNASLVNQQKSTQLQPEAPATQLAQREMPRTSGGVTARGAAQRLFERFQKSQAPSAAAAGAAGALLGKKSKEAHENSASSRMEPAPSFPPPPGIERPDMPLPDRTVNVPITNIGPPTTTFPDPGERKAMIESFPDQSDELLQAIIFENSRGTPETQDDNDYTLISFARAVRRWNLDEQHTHGGHAPDTGEYRKERFLKPEGDIRAARTDGTFVIRDERGEVIDDIQTVDTLTDGKTLNARERRNNQRIAELRKIRREKGHILNVPKSRGKNRKDWEKEVDELIEAHFRKRYGPPPDEK